MKNITRIAMIALGFYTATILSGCGSGTSAPMPAPAVIAINFTGGSSQTIPQGQSMLVTVNISNDPSGKGVTWKLSGPGALSKQTTTSVQYDPGPTVPSATTATITATSVADSTKVAVTNITITPPPLAISTASLPDGLVGTPYGRAIQATGGVAPFTWVLSVGALPHNLKLDNSTTGTLTISGTPDMQQAAVQFTISVTDSVNQSATQPYTVNINSPSTLTIGTSSVPTGTINVLYPTFSFSAAGGSSPLTWSEIGPLPAGLTFANNGTLSGTPTVTGSFLIKVTVTDPHGQMNWSWFTVVIYPGPALRRGRYVFQFQGFNPGGAFAAAGSFVADEFGTIGDAVLDTNGVIGPPVTNLALSGTYSIANNLGTVTLTGTQGNATFHFAPYPDASNSSISTGGRIIEFNGIKSGTGFIATQDVAAFSTSRIIHNYTFNFVGSTASGGRAAAVGRLTADGLGGFSGGVMDMNQAGAVSASVTFGGSYDLPATNTNGTPATNGRGTASLNTPLGTFDFTFYIQNIDAITNAPVLIFLGSDPVSASLPLLSGSMAPNAEAFNPNSLAGSLILGTTGLTSANHPDITVGIVTITSSGNYTLKADENSDGVITSINIAAGTYNVEPSGRVTLTGGNHLPVLYLTGTNSGYVLGTDGNVSTGTVIARTVPLSLEGTLSVSTGVPVTANQENDYGTLTFGTLNFTGNMNISTSTNFQPNTLVAGTYSLPSDGSGRGMLSFTSGLHTGTSVFYLIGHSRLALLDSVNPGDAAPVLFGGYCIDFVITPPSRGINCK